MISYGEYDYDNYLFNFDMLDVMKNDENNGLLIDNNADLNKSKSNQNSNNNLNSLLEFNEVIDSINMVYDKTIIECNIYDIQN